MPDRGLFGFPKPTKEEREQALADPGPTWREFFLYEFAKVWIILGFMIGDVIVMASFFQPLDVPAIIASAAVLVYLEFVAYQWLWYRPPLDEPRYKGPFRRRWNRWVEFGRWTPEADRRRAGLDPYVNHSGGPHPSEFL
jgi:hypothetical protein